MSGTALYCTADLHVAAFLKARGHDLVSASPTSGGLVEFTFNATPEDMEAYFAGEPLNAMELFQAHRALWQLVKNIQRNQFPNNHTPHNHRSLNQLEYESIHARY